ncbi:MAG: DUF4870 domain-containing protein [Candidatus Omnitrophota bacterium]
MKHVNQGKSSFGVEANIAALLSYLFGFISGVIFYTLEKRNKFVRFHAMQSIITFGSLFVFGAIAKFLPFIGSIIITCLGVIEIALWVILMIKAYQGKYFKLPVAGEIASRRCHAWSH